VIRTSKRLTTTLVAFSVAALFGAACGDDDGGSPDANTTADAAAADAGTPDGATVVATRSGTIALTEVSLMSSIPAVQAQAIGGAAITVSFDDLTTGDGNNVINQPNPGCSVTTYDCAKGDCPLPTSIDVGPITITNTTAETPAILTATPPACAFTGGAYRCPVGNFTGLTGTMGAGDFPSTAEFTFPKQTFAAGLRGTWVSLSGFADPFAGLNGQAVPVVQVVDNDTFVVALPGVTLPPAVPITGIGLTFLQGIGPVPLGAPGSPLGAIDFLADTDPATETVRIQRAANAAAGYPNALDITLGPAGEDFVLASTCEVTTARPGACITPLTFPTTVAADAPDDGVDYKFSCDGTGGNCGAAGSGGLLGAFALSGTATNGDTSAPGVDPFEMPTGTKFVQFSCTGIGTDIRLPNRVLKAILSIEPTRIESRVLRIAAPFPIEDATTKNVTRVVVGHGYVGHRDVPQAKSN
jgi:hypothetical protein